MKAHTGVYAQLCNDASPKGLCHLGTRVKISQRQQLWKTLTARDLYLARLVARGKRNKEIADGLCLSQYTVETHLKHIYDKLEIRSRTELTNFVRDLTALTRQDA
jgi:DNA-binding NarL/FixJ family response regulator